jgi:hypothetical protein
VSRNPWPTYRNVPTCSEVYPASSDYGSGGWVFESPRARCESLVDGHFCVVDQSGDGRLITF